MSVRTSRTRLITAAASIALATLSLTACGNDNGSADGKAAAAPSGTATPSATARPTQEATAAASASTTGTAAGTTSTGAGAAADPGTAPKTPAAPKPATKAPAPQAPEAAKPVTCTAATTKTTAAPLNRPVNHLLLTVTNTGTAICYLYDYPALQFGQAQSVPPVIADSKPQAVVTLQPGQSGYASVNLSSTDGTDNTNGYTSTTLDLYFHGPSGNESVGPAAHPALPTKGVYLDDSLKTTYWQQSMDDATSW
ncbi:DUF4232 domain-containing protein [Kitasatospora sp. NPDC127059]|uniref:DUF4232 domain-containing protein n=1 Tax=unclassified Kitasatospora TaxID=2633591 RepID=UPI00364DE9DF